MKNQPSNEESTQNPTSSVSPPTLTESTATVKDLTRAQPAPRKHKRLLSNNQHLDPTQNLREALMLASQNTQWHSEQLEVSRQ